MKSFVLWCLMLGAAAPSSDGDVMRPCTTADAMLADDEAASLKNWTEIYRSYRRFGQCDDGGIAEGYSDSIARQLAEHWDQTERLNQLASQDKGFEDFVLRHVDELMTPEQATTIRGNAELHCPRNAEALCRKIADQAKM